MEEAFITLARNNRSNWPESGRSDFMGFIHRAAVPVEIDLRDPSSILIALSAADAADIS